MVRSFLSERSDMPFEQLRNEFESNDVKARAGGEYVHLLYGPEPLFVSNGELQMDVKGLLFKPRERMSDGKLIVEL